MRAGKKSAEAERRAVRKAIAAMENMSRANLRYRRDSKKSNPRHAGRRGEMDCVDESLNTTEYLYFLKGQGLLTHHTPTRNYAERGFLINGYPHKSAVMKQKNGDWWAVDSWAGQGGAEPEVIPLSKWRRQRSSLT